MIAAVWTVWYFCQRSPVVWLALGVTQASQPFVDLYGLLASSDGYWAGLNVFVPFDWDPYRRPFIYGEWWFVLGQLGLGRKDNVWLGFLLGALVLVTSVYMARPRTLREWVYLFLLLTSPAWLLSFTRANNDVIVLLLVSAGLLCWRSARWPARLLGILLFAACAALKYYPLVTLVLLLEVKTRREWISGALLYGLVLVLSWPLLEAGFKTAARFMPGPTWSYAYGAPILLRNFGLESRAAWMIPGMIAVGWALWLTWRHAQRAVVEEDKAARTDQREFVCGAAMLVGLFFLGATYNYKLVLAVWTLPWLWHQARTAGAERHWARAALVFLLGVASLDGWAAVGINVWLASWSLPAALLAVKITLAVTQFLAWGLVLCLLRLAPVIVGAWMRRWYFTVIAPEVQGNGLPAAAR